MAQPRSAKQNVVAAVAVVVTLVAGYFILNQTVLRSPRAQSRGAVYLYDLATGELAVGSPSPDAIRASVFACASCDDDADRFTAYIQKTTPEAIAEMDKAEPNIAALEGGQLIAAPATDPDWKQLSSPAGQALIESVYKKCETPKACNP